MSVHCSVMVNRSIVIASVGQRVAHSPHRMHRSSSLIMAASGRPVDAALASSASGGAWTSALLDI